jgi:hypothetical protein
MNQNKLPADPTAMILGIIALVIGLAGCCCYGIFAIIPLILSIVGLVMANKSLKEFALNPEAYSSQSRSNVATAKILNIIAIIFNGMVILLFIIFFAIYGTLITSGIIEGIKESQNRNYYESDDDSYDDDTYDYKDDEIIIEDDTMRMDSINIDKINEVKIDTIKN